MCLLWHISTIELVGIWLILSLYNVKVELVLVVTEGSDFNHGQCPCQLTLKHIRRLHLVKNKMWKLMGH